jgi:molybdenum cofactor biosynthesis enzyme MoaA
MAHLPVLIDSANGSRASQSQRAAVMKEIDHRLVVSGSSLADAIQRRSLYFRISIIGTCNLSCKFCHNEGAPAKGRLTIESATRAIEAALRVGFRRVQFTGGEPLLHKEVGGFVGSARRLLEDVGVTTNGTFLQAKLPDLMSNGIHRIHVSLQTESLVEAGEGGVWGIPDFLAPALQHAGEGAYKLRLNLPVPADSLPASEHFLEALIPYGCDIQAFSILPEGSTASVPFPIEELEALVARANARRRELGSPAKVLLRGYRPPTGIRCPTCIDYDRCKEQSHSLRLGTDNILKPCLASRFWDAELDEGDLDRSIRDMARLALDYEWPELAPAAVPNGAPGASPDGADRGNLASCSTSN